MTNFMPHHQMDQATLIRLWRHKNLHEEVASAQDPHSCCLSLSQPPLMDSLGAVMIS